MTFTTRLYTTLLLLSTWSCLCASASPRNVTTSSKAGLAWPNGDADDMSQFESPKLSWYYTWSPSPVEDDTLEFVPMLWGQNQASAFASSINSTIANKNVRAVLAMNEPNQAGQSDISPSDAAGLWQSLIQPLHGLGLRLGSPAPTSAPDGKTWLQSFLGNCSGCTVDFIALHYYATNATQFVSYMEDMHATFNLPIWVTEWACQDYNGGPQCSSSDVRSFLSATQGFMDTTPWVERYSWFGAMENLQGVNEANALMDKSGKITSLGEQYTSSSSSNSSQGSSPSKSDATRLPTRISAALAVALVVLVVTHLA